MQAKANPGAAPSTVTRSARRAQIVAAAIEVIANLGSQKTSFARIAEHAGLSSTGVISYHFRDKDELFVAVVGEIEQVLGAAMAPYLEAATGHLDKVRAYVEANVALVGRHPAEVGALIDLVTSRSAGSPAVDRRLALFTEHFRAGQAAGELHDFDPGVVAAAIAGGLDKIVAELAAGAPDPGELARAGQELAAFYTRGLAADARREETS